MSKHNHNVIAHEVSFTINEINKLTEDEVRSIYGIELLENGKVFDPTYNKKFESVGEWAEFNIEQDDVEFEEHFSVKN
jgi:hypothetical protein